MNDYLAVTTLQDLIETSRDGEAGFRTCAEEVMGLQLKSAFTCRSQRCAAAARELSGLLATIAGDGGVAAGSTFHRRWTDIRAIILNRDNGAIVIQCERGDAMALNSYRNALEADLPVTVRVVLERHYQAISQHHEQIKLLREQMRAYG